LRMAAAIAAGMPKSGTTADTKLAAEFSPGWPAHWDSKVSKRPATNAPAARVSHLICCRSSQCPARYRTASDTNAGRCASTCCEQAAAVARERGDAADQAAVLNTQGTLARGLNKYAESRQAHEAALPLARAAGDRGDAATALLGLAYVAMFTGDGARAAALAEEGLAEARASGDQVILAQVLFFVSWVASNGAGFERADVLATEALSLFTRLGDTSGGAEAMFVLATVALYSARYAEAVDLLTVCLNLHRDGGAEPITARDLGALGSGLLNLGELAGARAALDESLVVARRYEDRWSSAMSLMLLGHVDLAEGDVAHAQAVLAEAGSLFASTGNMVYFPWCLEGLAALAVGQGDFERAAELAGARDTLREQIGVFLPPVYPAGYDRTLQAAQAHLTPAAFDAAQARSADLPPPQIIATALGGLVGRQTR
jgi:tetratricopeptide (TPR) repeat protein